MEVGYCRLVTISTDNISETNEFRGGVGAHWPFLSDTRRVIQKDLDIAEYIDPTHNPMIPHTIVPDPDLVIYKIYILVFRPASTRRLAPGFAGGAQEISVRLGYYNAGNQSCMAAGQKELFYPYGKTYAETIAEQE